MIMHWWGKTYMKVAHCKTKVPLFEVNTQKHHLWKGGEAAKTATSTLRDEGVFMSICPLLIEMMLLGEAIAWSRSLQRTDSLRRIFQRFKKFRQLVGFETQLERFQSWGPDLRPWSLLELKERNNSRLRYLIVIIDPWASAFHKKKQKI